MTSSNGCGSLGGAVRVVVVVGIKGFVPFPVHHPWPHFSHYSDRKMLHKQKIKKSDKQQTNFKIFSFPALKNPVILYKSANGGGYLSRLISLASASSCTTAIAMLPTQPPPPPLSVVSNSAQTWVL